MKNLWNIDEYKKMVREILLKQMDEEKADELMKKYDEDLLEFMILGWGPKTAVDQMLLGY